MTCLMLNCQRDAYCRGLCRSHYTRWRRQEKPEPLAEWAAIGGPLMRPCVVCGSPFRADRSRTACSDECDKNRKRARWRQNYHNLPEYRKKAAVERSRAKRQADPEYAKDIDRRKWERTKADPERYAHVREKAKEHYARHAQRIQEKRRRRMEAMTTEELARLRDRMREYQRKWKRTRRDDEQTRDAEQSRRRARQARLNWQRLGTLEAELAARTGQSRPCIVCGKPIVGRKAGAKTCSRKCALRRHNQLLYPPRPRPCVVCGKMFDSRTSAKACSKDCRRAHRLGTTPDQLPPPLPESTTCDVCGKPFRPTRHRQKGCSPECMKAGRLRRRLEKTRLPPIPRRRCEICGAWFVPDRKNAKFCSLPWCKAEAHRRMERGRAAQNREALRG